MNLKRLKYLALISMFITIFSCKDEKTKINESLNTQIDESQDKSYHLGDVYTIDTKDFPELESVVFQIDGKNFKDKVPLTAENIHLGENYITFQATKDGEIINSREIKINVFAKEAPKNIGYEIIKEYPHNPDFFTQGFQYFNGKIYEGTGLNGHSRLMSYTLGETNPKNIVSQPQEIFGEGITLLNGKIYQLTWKNRQILVYDVATLKAIETLDMPADLLEGWGITTDGKSLIISDGTSLVQFYHASDLKLERTIEITSDKKIYDQINELEYYNGKLYANVWQAKVILEIDLSNGAVTGILDLSKIADQNTKTEGDDVLNGIAFKDSNMLITGKKWSKIYELKLQ